MRKECFLVFHFWLAYDELYLDAIEYKQHINRIQIFIKLNYSNSINQSNVFMVQVLKNVTPVRQNWAPLSMENA